MTEYPYPPPGDPRDPRDPRDPGRPRDPSGAQPPRDPRAGGRPHDPRDPRQAPPPQPPYGHPQQQPPQPPRPQHGQPPPPHARPAPGPPPPGTDPQGRPPYPPRPPQPHGPGTHPPQQPPPPDARPPQPPPGHPRRPPQAPPPGTDPYARPTAPPGADPYGRPTAPPPGTDPYARPPAPPPGTGPRPGAAPDGTPYPPPLYRPEEGWGGAGFALPEEYRTPEDERPQEPAKRLLPRLSRPVRVLASVAVLVVGVGVAVGMPFREQLHDYQKQKKTALSYTTVPRKKAGAIAGTRFVLYSMGPAESYVTYKAPAGTAGVKAVIYFKSPTQQTSDRMSYLEYAFRDARGRTWAAKTLGGALVTPGKITKVELRGLVPKDVASQVLPVVQPKQVLDGTDDPTKAVREPALVFQR